MAKRSFLVLLPKFPLIIFIFLYTCRPTSARSARSAQELTRCVRIAEPLIHNPDYVFPLSVPEIRNVCEKWDEFVDCVRHYASTFLTPGQQRDFDSIIQPSMKSIHQLCTQDPQYQQAYLYYAPFMKSISIEEKFCGTHYSFLARLAESTADTVPAICCGYHKFRNCVLREAQKESFREKPPIANIPGGDSTHFVSSMLNRALGFLLQMCKPSQSEHEDCLASLTGGRESKLNTIDSENGDNFNNPDNTDTANVNLGGFAGISPPSSGANDNTDNYNYNPRYPSSWSPSHLSSGQTTQPANRRPSPVTVYPPNYHNGNSFTWTTTDRSSFFPTRNTSYLDILANELREPERFRGSNSGHGINPSISLIFVSIMLACGLLTSSQRRSSFLPS